MCGIIGYIGSSAAYPLLIRDLKKLEYRGYDSAGVAILDDKLKLVKCKGRVADLEKVVGSNKPSGTIGIGHTRWATHGAPDDKNAHPHRSMNGHFVVIHNGIIENYSSLKKRLKDRGYSFVSDTDTEVLVNLIEYIYLKGKVSAEVAVRLALRKIIGAYGLVVMNSDEPDKLIAARKGSPLVIGVADHSYFLASDATPIVEYTKKVIYLNDNDLAVLTRDELHLHNLDNHQLTPVVQTIDLDIESVDKGAFDHFMLKEIFEQSHSIEDTFRGRILAGRESIQLGGLFEVLPQLIQAKRIIIIGCGTSWHAGLVGEYLIEEFAQIPVEVEYGSEFRYRKTVLYKSDVVIAVSQSGETADTLAAIRKAKEAGALVIGICNVVSSSIPRETQGGIYTHAGPEIGVASTKAFTSQVTVLTMLAMLLGRKREVFDGNKYQLFIKELQEIPQKIEILLKDSEQIKTIARKYKNVNNFIYLGRGYSFPVALEGALKLKEISYIHAEGYPAAEMKHGPIALIDKNMPVVVIAPQDDFYEKVVSNIQEIKSRKGIVIAIVSQGDDIISNLADHVIEVPETNLALTPLLTVIPLQLLAYHIAVLRGCNVDQPRNLAKSVTVE